jgi:hypothetical protein
MIVNTMLYPAQSQSYRRQRQSPTTPSNTVSANIRKKTGWYRDNREIGRRLEAASIVGERRCDKNSTPEGREEHIPHPEARTAT